MTIAALVLEYLKVLLSPQCVAGLVAIVFFSRFSADISALMRRVASIKLPGGAEFSAPQLARTAEDRASDKEPPALPAGTAPPLPEGIHLTPEQANAVAETLRAERAKAYLWEYRYLNHFLVPNTQRVLDWLAGLKERTTYGMYDAWWLPIIQNANERRAIINALQAHYLIIIGDGELMEVTPKGREYIEWRGSMASPPVASGAS
jgi:hypothetical protein